MNKNYFFHNCTKKSDSESDEDIKKDNEDLFKKISLFS